MIATLQFLLLCFFLNATTLTVTERDSRSELFSDVKIAVVAEGQGNAVDNLSCESLDCDFLAFTLTLPPLSPSHFENRLLQIRLDSYDISSNLIRAPPQ
ncbi:hypothetical protein [Litorilituus lipolyticus]|uniref:Uncharacterized protein n=1 Tax=Litorilituus lipolyticus TaxID=2491017 RepID=A0A502KV42_9GAMM|nr:hypothetical protein [Litorilituus lipolyticus]TPH12097.1 hypothetical protein EPA86_17220 [Litorilituus lipolyticus]